MPRIVPSHTPVVEFRKSIQLRVTSTPPCHAMSAYGAYKLVTATRTPNVSSNLLLGREPVAVATRMHLKPAPPWRGGRVVSQASSSLKIHGSATWAKLVIV